MKTQQYDINSSFALRIVFLIAFIEFCIFVFSGVSFSFLYEDPFFDLPIDPLLFLVFGLRLPQFILSNNLIGLCLDVIIIILFVFILLRPHNIWFAMSLFLTLLLFYCTLTGYLTHRNFQSGFFMVFFPFIFRRPESKRHAFEATRYFILFFYFSAAILKITSGALLDTTHFSKVVEMQFLPYFLEGNLSWRTTLNLFIISHTTVASTLYWLAFLAEFVCLTGFFTKRFDKLIMLVLVFFHFFNWIVMDIAPLGQLAFLSLLLFFGHPIFPVGIRQDVSRLQRVSH